MDPDEIHELFAGIGPVTIRRMFGGQGIYRDGVMFGLVARGDLYLKADATSSPAFVAAGSTPFTYTRGEERSATLPYWRPPLDAFDDPDEMTRWATLAVEAAGRAARAKTSRRKR